MGKWLKIAGGLAGWVFICLQAGCMRPVETLPGPSWHQLGSGCYDTVEGRFFYGVGRAGGVRNRMLLRAAADNRAREELAGVLEQYIQELARSVSGNTGSNWEMLAFEERRQVLGMVVRRAMQNALIFDHWNEPLQGRMLSLCRLSLSDFKMVLSASGVLDESMRSAMVSGAEKVYARLARKL
jgi:hypothetical protein